MRRLILSCAAAGAASVATVAAAWRGLLRLRMTWIERDLQLLNTHAQRMAAERVELIARRADIALLLLDAERGE